MALVRDLTQSHVFLMGAGKAYVSDTNTDKKYTTREKSSPAIPASTLSGRFTSYHVTADGNTAPDGCFQDGQQGESHINEKKTNSSAQGCIAWLQPFDM